MEEGLPEEVRDKELELDSLRQLSTQLSQLQHQDADKATATAQLFQAVEADYEQLQQQLADRLASMHSLQNEQQDIEKQLKVLTNICKGKIQLLSTCFH